jgi:hypothetical protein
VFYLEDEEKLLDDSDATALHQDQALQLGFGKQRQERIHNLFYQFGAHLEKKFSVLKTYQSKQNWMFNL